MKRVAASILIAAPLERVWDLYADVEGSVRWVPFVEEILYVSGPAGPGQVYRERTRFGAIRNVTEWRVVEWDPPRRQVQRATGMNLETHLVLAFEPAGERTRARQEVVLRSALPPPLSWFQEQLVAMVSRRGIGQALRAAKRYLERGTA